MASPHDITYTSHYYRKFFTIEIAIRPLPHSFVIRDLVPDLSDFYAHYEKVEPWLQRKDDESRDEAASQGENTAAGYGTELRQSIAERAELDGLYECVMCACCTTSCPSQWWHPETFLGPQALLAAQRWIGDSRDEMTDERLAKLNDAMALHRCHNIQNCTDCCPKSLKPSVAIEMIKKKIQDRIDDDKWEEILAKKALKPVKPYHQRS